MKSTYRSLIFVLLLSVFTVLPFINSGFFPMHDNTQVARVFEMGKSLLDGMFPVRWVNDLGYGYGYPIFNFYAPLAYYIGGSFVALGLSSLLATKLMMVIGVLLAGISMYILAKEIWGELGGIVAALFYLFAPYHAVDIYVRGDVAEFWAYAFIPFVFYGLVRLSKNSLWRYVAITSLSLSGLIISHNLSALMVFPFVFAVATLVTILNLKKKNNLKSYFPIGSLFLGIILSSFYFLPVFAEMKYTNVLSQVGGGADFRNHFVCISQFWYSQWGFGGSAQGCNDGLSFMIGKLSIFAALFSALILFVFPQGKNQYQKFSITIGLLGLICSIFFAHQVSQVFWENIPFMAFLQYPWRFLVLISFFSAFLSGSIVWFIRKKYESKFSLIAFVIVIAGLLFLQTKYFSPQMITQNSPGSYTNKSELNWNISKISDEYMPKSFKKPKNVNEIPNKLVARSNFISELDKTNDKKFSISLNRDENLLIKLAYFPAWNAYIDGKKAPLSEALDGMVLAVSSGSHVIELKYNQTLVEILGDLLTLAGIVMLFLGIIISNKQKLHENTNR